MIIIVGKWGINGGTASEHDVFWNSESRMTSFLKSLKLTSHIFSNVKISPKWYINDETSSKYDLFWNSGGQISDDVDFKKN